MAPIRQTDLFGHSLVNSLSLEADIPLPRDEPPFRHYEVDTLVLRAYTRFMPDPCHCLVLRKTTRKLGALYDAALAPVGINIAQFSVLRTVNHVQPVSLTDLGGHLELDRSTMGRNVRVLEKQGLVEFVRGEDQREAVVRLSGEGMDKLRAAEPLWEACQDKVETQLGSERLAALAELNRLL